MMIIINDVTFLLLSDWLRGACWAWRRWNRGEGRSDKSPLCLLCRIASQIPLQRRNRLVRNKLAASWQLPRLRGSYVETCVMDFGLNSLTSQMLTCLLVNLRTSTRSE